MMEIRTPHRDAIRLLFSIRAGSQPLEGEVRSDIAAIFRGETRLQAFDFWIRNPDYLAAELLDLFKATNDQLYLSAARSIFDNEEPDLRRVPMIRYLYGAYESMDDALSLLKSRNLIQITGLKSHKKVHETNFLLTTKGADVCASCMTTAPVLNWYADRAELVAKVAGDRGGAALKQQQYERVSYAGTKLGGVIPSIADDVMRGLEALEALV